MPTSPNFRDNSASSQSNIVAIAAAVIGNTLEWFDVLVYGYFVTYIALAFFPSQDSATSTMFAFGAFAIAFIARPLGAVLLGRYADVAGRQKALVLITGLMFIGTATIAILPTHRQIGSVAAVILIVARLIQGFSAGGEFGGATAFLVERSNSHKGFFASWQFASQGMGMLLAASFGAVLTSILSPSAMQEWGWRVPFLFGLLIGPVAYFIRKNVTELGPTSQAAMAETSTPLGIKTLGTLAMTGRVTVGIGLVLAATVSIYLLVYMPTYAVSLGLDSNGGYSSAALAGLLILIISPIAGWASDRYGFLRVAVPAVAAMAILPLPAFLWLAGSPSPVALHSVQALVAVIAATYFGSLPVALSRLFPAHQRALGLALSYNFAVMGGGGIAPIVFTLTTRFTGSDAGPCYYLVVAACITSISLWFVSRSTTVQRS